MFQNRQPVLEITANIGQEVTIIGWVQARRNMGKIVFLDVRDRSGFVQVVGVPAELDPDSLQALQDVRLEYLVQIRGIVQERGEKQKNSNLPTGSIELLAKEVKVISSTEALPFEVSGNTKETNEALRLKYRYLDLRSDRMRENLKKRHELNHFLRTFFTNENFWEIETPCLTKGTPEGSREYIVPARLHPGSFYVLPQSPQQFKQLLMVGGVERYFQIARCFRDEDQRGDRQPEFTQFDLEMSFVNQEDIMQLIERAMIELVEKLYPEKILQQKPFPVLTYKEAMDQYGVDKPDIRKDKHDKNLLAFCWVVDFPLFEYSETDKKIVATHHPFTRPNEEDQHLLESKPLEVRARAYDIVLNGFEIGGGSLRIFERELQAKVFELLGLSKEETEKRFGHMLEAFTFAPPPHGGLALGLDRIIAILQGEENIREVIAFPKTGDARDLMMNAPSPLPSETLKEAHVKLDV